MAESRIQSAASLKAVDGRYRRVAPAQSIKHSPAGPCLKIGIKDTLQQRLGMDVVARTHCRDSGWAYPDKVA